MLLTIAFDRERNHVKQRADYIENYLHKHTLFNSVMDSAHTT